MTPPKPADRVAHRHIVSQLDGLMRHPTMRLTSTSPEQGTAEQLWLSMHPAVWPKLEKGPVSWRVINDVQPANERAGT